MAVVGNVAFHPKRKRAQFHSENWPQGSRKKRRQKRRPASLALEGPAPLRTLCAASRHQRFRKPGTNQEAEADSSASSGALVCLMKICAAQMPTSYRMHMGMASDSCDTTSGGVTMAAITNAITMK